jgi:transcriptional regulator with XRE-family HTH domain
MDFEHYNRIEIGTLLLRLREKSNITQKQLAKKAGVSSSTVSNVEKAKGKRASQQTIKRLFSAIGIGWSEIPVLLKKEEGEKDQFLQMIQLKLTSIENHIDYGYLSEGKKELKIIEAELKDHPLISIVHYLNGKCFFRKGKEYWSKAYSSFQDAIGGAQSSNLLSSNVIAASYYELSRIYSRSNNYQEALAQVENGLQTFDPAGERKSTKHVLLISKIIYLEKLEQHIEAKNVLDETRKYAIEMDTETKLNMYQSEVNLLYREKLYEQAIQKAKHAIDISRREKNYDRCFEMWTTLGSIYKDMGNLKMAKVCFETAAEWESRIKEINMVAYNATELGKLYCQIADFSVAESHLQNAVELSKKSYDVFYEFEALRALSELCLQHDRIKEGIHVLEEACILANKHGLYTQEKNAALKLAKFYKNKDKRKYQDFLTLFYEISVKLSNNGGEEDMSFEDLNRRAGNPPDN